MMKIPQLAISTWDMYRANRLNAMTIPEFLDYVKEQKMTDKQIEAMAKKISLIIDDLEESSMKDETDKLQKRNEVLRQQFIKKGN